MEWGACRFYFGSGYHLWGIRYEMGGNIRSVNQSITERIFSFLGEWRTISFPVADDCSFSRCWGWGSVDKGNF